MNYNTLKATLDSKCKELGETKKKLLIEKDMLNNLGIEKDKALSSIRKEMSSDFDLKLKEHRRELTAPATTTLEKLNNQKLQLASKFKLDYNSINEESVKTEYLKEFNVYTELKDITKEMGSTLKGMFGDGFKQRLDNVLSHEDFPLEVNSTAELYKKAKSINDSVKRIKKITPANGKIFDNFLKSSTLHDGDTTHHSMTHVLVIFILLFFLVLFGKYTLAPYLSIVVIIALNKFKKSRTALYALRDYQSIVSNINDLDNMINEEVRSLVVERKEQSRLDFTNKEKQLNKEVEDEENKLRILDNKAKASFEFDDILYKRKEYDLDNHIDSKSNNLKASIKSLDDKILVLNKDINSINENMNKILGELKSQYFNNTICESNILKTDFLLDIIGDKPIIWRFPKKSILFIYDDLEVMTTLLKIIMLQTFSRISPFFIKFDLVDTVYACDHFNDFIMEDKSIFNNIDDVKDIRLVIDRYVTLTKKRKQKLFKGFEDIDSYNSFMLEQESIPESFNFLVMLTYPDAFFKDEALKTLMRIGSPAGNYSIFCIESKALKDTEIDKIEVLDAVDVIYTLTNGDIRVKSKDYISKAFS